MKAQTLLLSALLVAVSFGAGCGCDPGMAPAGMSNDDAKAAIERMTPEQKIKLYASSPMSQAEKEAKYAEIEKETGVKASDVLSGKPVNTGAGN
ncbi:MAG: hypothetical protein KIS66_08050 [Fimbriimonadaceae bacterium]|nr:hypothetical protein [Fimbriimonadaceae bacterium]